MSDPIRSTPRVSIRAAALVALGAAFAGPLAAQTAAGADADSSVYLQYGWKGSSKAYGVGATRDWPSAWSWGFAGGRLSGYWEADAQLWKFPTASDGSSTTTRLGKFELAPIFRFRGDAGRSPWFVDAGIGLTLTTHLYRTEDKAASTAFNFGDQLAVGWLFGPEQAHEVALRFEHMSNASIKEPNPAINFYQLRYAYHFGR